MEAVLIYPHQLFEDHPALASGRMVYLVEDPLYFSQYKFHMQKLVLHRASMKAYAELLGTKGYGVRYIDHAVLQTKNIGELLADDGMQKAHIVDVVDTWLEKRGTQSLGQKEIQIVWYETPQFLTSDTDIKTYWKTQKHLQQHFYIWQRLIFAHGIENILPNHFLCAKACFLRGFQVGKAVAVFAIHYEGYFRFVIGYQAQDVLLRF